MANDCCIVRGGYYVIDDFSRFLELFVYPTGFWFIAAILELYIVFYLITKASVSYRTALLFGIAWYVLRYVEEYENYFFVESALRVTAGLIAMLVGACWRLRVNRNEIDEKSINKWVNLLIAILAMGGFGTIKILLSKNVMVEMQFLTHVFSIVFAYNLLVFMYSIEKKLAILDQSLIGKLMVKVSTCSLEVYMIQGWIIKKFEGIVFPVNLLLILSMVLFASYFIHFVSTSLADKIENMVRSKSLGGT